MGEEYDLNIVLKTLSNMKTSWYHANNYNYYTVLNEYFKFFNQQNKKVIEH